MRIQLSGATSGVQSWRIHADLDGKSSQPIQDLAGSATRLSLQLPQDAQGKLSVRVLGVADFPFYISKGSGSIVTSHEEVLDLTIPVNHSEVCTDEGWCWERPYPTGRTINAMWASGPSDIWAAGTAGLILHFDGIAWDVIGSGIAQDFLSVFGVSKDEVYFGSEGSSQGPTVMRWDGQSIQPFPLKDPLPNQSIVAIWASGSNDLWFATQPRNLPSMATLYRWDTGTWYEFPQSQWGPSNPIYFDSMAGATPRHPWISGRQGSGQGFLIQKGDAGWIDLSAKVGVPNSISYATRLVVKSDTDIWLTYDRKIVRFDGSNTVTDLKADQISNPCYWSALVVLSSTEAWAAPGPSCVTSQPLRPWRYTAGAWGQVADSDLPDGTRALSMINMDQDVWTAGTLGVIRQYSASRKTWVPHLPKNIAEVDSATSLGGITGTDPTNVWAVGSKYYPLSNTSSGIALHREGNEWKTIDVGDNFGFSSIWAVNGNPQDIWVVGSSNNALHFDGKTWSKFPTGVPLYAVWGASTNDVWAAGPRLEVRHWDGANWLPVDTKLSLPSAADIGRYNFRNVWGVAGQRVWLIGGRDDGVMSATVFWQYDPIMKIWTDLTTDLLNGTGRAPNARPPQNVWASSKDNIWVSGRQWIYGAVYDSGQWSPTSWSSFYGTIFGSASDSVWSFGPDGESARLSAGTSTQGTFGSGGAKAPIYINNGWAASRDELWIVGDLTIILHRKPR